MKRLLLPLLAAIALPTAVNANVDPKVAEFCLKAADFAGCVKTMTTKSSDIPSMRLIQGKTELTGNSCPSGFAYAGAGNCRSIERAGFNEILTVDAIGLWRAGHVDRPVWHTYYKLGYLTKAVSDPNCPDREPYLYTQKSCNDKPTPPSLKEIKRILSLVGVRRENKARIWNNKLENIFGIPNLASDAINYKKSPSKQSSTTGSVKINCDSPVWRDKPRCN